MVDPTVAEIFNRRVVQQGQLTIPRRETINLSPAQKKELENLISNVQSGIVAREISIARTKEEFGIPQETLVRLEDIETLQTLARTRPGQVEIERRRIIERKKVRVQPLTAIIRREARALLPGEVTQIPRGEIEARAEIITKRLTKQLIAVDVGGGLMQDAAVFSRDGEFVKFELVGEKGIPFSKRFIESGRIGKTPKEVFEEKELRVIPEKRALFGIPGKIPIGIGFPGIDIIDKDTTVKFLVKKIREIEEKRIKDPSKIERLNERLTKRIAKLIPKGDSEGFSITQKFFELTGKRFTRKGKLVSDIEFFEKGERGKLVEAGLKEFKAAKTSEEQQKAIKKLSNQGIEVNLENGSFVIDTKKALEQFAPTSRVGNILIGLTDVLFKATFFSPFLQTGTAARTKQKLKVKEETTPTSGVRFKDLTSEQLDKVVGNIKTKASAKGGSEFLRDSFRRALKTGDKKTIETTRKFLEDAVGIKRTRTIVKDVLSQEGFISISKAIIKPSKTVPVQIIEVEFDITEIFQIPRIPTTIPITIATLTKIKPPEGKIELGVAGRIPSLSEPTKTSEDKAIENLKKQETAMNDKLSRINRDLVKVEGPTQKKGLENQKEKIQEDLRKNLERQEILQEQNLRARRIQSRIETTSELVLLKSQQAQVDISLQKESLLQKELLSVTSALASAQTSLQKQKLAQRLKQLQKKVQRTKQIQKQRLKGKGKSKVRGLIIPLVRLKSPDKIKVKKKPKEKKGVFDVFVRRFGKDVKIKDDVTFKKAKKVLRTRLQKRLRASGFVQDNFGRKVRTGLSKEPGFRKSKIDKFRVVELKKFRLDSKLERKSIQEFRKIARKNKSIKLPKQNPSKIKISSQRRSKSILSIENKVKKLKKQKNKKLKQEKVRMKAPRKII